MPSFNRKKKAKKAKPLPAAEAPAPVIPPPPRQSPHASPVASITTPPRESPLRRILRRSTSSLGDSWRGLKNRRASVSSVVGGTGMGGMEETAQITPSRSRGSDAFSPITDVSPGPASRSGSIRTTPLRPRPDPAGPTNLTESPNTTHHRHRATSSLSSVTTFPSPNPATPAKPSSGTAPVRESVVATIQTIASSHQPSSPQNQFRRESHGTMAEGSSDPGERSPQRMAERTSLGMELTARREELGATYTAPLTPPTPLDEPHAVRDQAADDEHHASPEQDRVHHEDHAPLLAPALGFPLTSPQHQPEATPPETDPRSSCIRAHPSVQEPITASPITTDVFGQTVVIPSPGRAERNENSPAADVTHETRLPPVTADWIATPPSAAVELGVGDVKVEVRGIGALEAGSPSLGTLGGSASDDMRMGTGEGGQDLELKEPASPRLGMAGSSLGETHLGTPQGGGQDLGSNPPSSPRPGMAGTVLEEMHPRTEGHDQEHASKPPSSPRLKAIGIIPDIPVPEESFLPGTMHLHAAHAGHHSHIVHALEPVLEETPKATEIERFAGLPYLDETKHRRDKGKGKAVDHPTGSVVAVRTSGQKKLHMFEGGNTTKARHATTPPTSPSFDNLSGPSTPPLTHVPLDRTTYPPLPPTPPRIRWEPIHRHPNRAQHTEHAAVVDSLHEGRLHEAGAGGIAFTQFGGVWIGRPPASLNSVALRALALVERERGRDAEVRRESGRQVNAQVAKAPRIIITPPASPTTAASLTTAPAPASPSTATPTQLPMLPFVPRIFAPRLTLDFQWADTWLPSDVTLETADPAVPTHSISLYESIRKWTGLAGSAPTRRITNTDN